MAATSPMAAAAALRKANNVSCTSATAAKLSRTEYMSWLNTLLASSYAEAKELGTGEAYCQFVHCIFPEAIQLKKVKWNSQAQSDWSDNLKLMAMALKSLGVVKIIAVERLVECKTMENFEFLQWCYLFYAANKKYAPENYDALAARGGIIIPKYRNENDRLSAQARATALISPRARAEMLRSPNEQSQAMLGRREQQQYQQQQQQPYQQQQQYQQQYQQQQQQQQQSAAALEAQLRQYAEAAEILQREKEELAEDLREADKDRNDYYAKLCAIETYCKAAREEDQSAKTVLNLLYKAEAQQRAQAEQQQQRAQQQEARAAQQQQQRAQQEEESCAAQQQRAQEEARAAQRAYELCCNRVESAEMNANEEAMEQERAM